VCGGTTDLAGYVAPNETCDVYDIISRYKVYLHESNLSTLSVLGNAALLFANFFPNWYFSWISFCILMSLK
jgi:hypothetical protein